MKQQEVAGAQAGGVDRPRQENGPSALNYNLSWSF